MARVRVGAVVMLAVWPVLCSAAGGSVQVRVRFSRAVLHDGFAYQGRHWLRGTAASVTDDTLGIRAPNGLV